MAFQQLYYTSCARGLGRYGGYQFNAITPGVSPVILREVEERTIYEPPRWLQADPALEEPEAYPVAFCYGISEATGMAITANVVFAGTDYSGRPGNYFAHALVTGMPEQDFGPLLPAELWGAPVWQSTPAGGTELPELPGPLPPGVIDRPGVQAFLDARKADDVLPELLTAVGRAMAGDRPVLVVSDDVTENAWWIAAVSYLLGQLLARRMTFTTYSHRPGYSRYHLTGVLPGMLPPDAGTSFQIFDFAGGGIPDGGIHPLAAILASTGVMASAGLWQQARAFAAGTEDSLDEWLGPVTAAAGLLGRQLSPAEADAVAGWLTYSAGRLPSALADVVLGVALAQPGWSLTDERLVDLLAVARGLAVPVRVEHLERLIVGRAIAHLGRGEPTVPVRLTSPAVEIAREQAAAILEVAPPDRALAVLEWTSASGAVLPDAELEQYGRTRLDPATPEPLLAHLVSSYPAVLRGLLRRLALEPPEVTKTVLSGPVGTRLRRDDLAGYPELTELWLIQSVGRGGTKPLRALDEIVDIRLDAHRSPVADAALLRLLWPGGCPPEQLAELLGILTDPPAPDVVDWFAGEIGAVSARGTTSDEWLGLAQVLADHRILPLLPEQETLAVRNAVRVLPLLNRARLAGPRGDVVVFAELFREYRAADGETRRLLARELPPLLAWANPLGAALRDCPEDVASAFGSELHEALAPGHADIALARRVFAALADPDVRAQAALSEPLSEAFEQVRGWHRRELGDLAHALEKNDELARSFRDWRQARRGGLARRLRGGTGPPAPER
jgi:GTPase-associated protein 1, N-terminal domain type 2/GTPase-associated protein 1, C-terminal domain/GTPase-associated protein 1, middle domain